MGWFRADIHQGFVILNLENANRVMQTKDNYLHCLKDSPVHTGDLKIRRSKRNKKESHELWVSCCPRCPLPDPQNPFPGESVSLPLEGTSDHVMDLAAAPRSNADLHLYNLKSSEWTSKEEILNISRQVGGLWGGPQHVGVLSSTYVCYPHFHISSLSTLYSSSVTFSPFVLT